MSHPKDIDEHGPEQGRELLVDLLYGELADDAHAHAEQVIEGDSELRAEFDALGDLRALMRSLPDEEPSPAITAKLLHAAAMHAPQATSQAAEPEKQREGGLWAWLTGLFQPLVMHPGLAAAASLVLVAGIAGTLLLTGQARKEQPLAMSDQSAPAGQVAEPAAAARPALPEPVAAARDEGIAAPEDPEIGGEIAEESGGGAVAELKKGATRGVESKPKDAKRPRKAKKRRSSPTDRFAGYYDGKLDTSGADVGEDSDEAAIPAGDIASGSTRSAPTTRSAPATRSAPTRSAPATGSTKAGEKTPADKPAVVTSRSSDRIGIEAQSPEPDVEPSPPAPVESNRPRTDDQASRLRSLHNEARSAARQDDCTSVRSIGNRVRKLNAAYYRDRFAKDTALRACLSAAK